MKKLAFVLLLLSSSAFADIDAASLAKTILNPTTAGKADKGSFAMVWGGQDISRSGMLSTQAGTMAQPILIG